MNGPPEPGPPAPEGSPLRPAARDVAEAMRFLRGVRADPELRDKVDALEPGAGARAVTEIAAAAGFHFAQPALGAAYAHDWGLRWMHYHPPGATESR
jgi:nitrogen fixation uncharacterized protein